MDKKFDEMGDIKIFNDNKCIDEQDKRSRLYDKAVFIRVSQQGVFLISGNSCSFDDVSSDI